MPDGPDDLARRIEELTEEVRLLRATEAHQGGHGLGFSEDQYNRYLRVRDVFSEQLHITSDDVRAYLNVMNLLHHDEGGLIRFVRPC